MRQEFEKIVLTEAEIAARVREAAAWLDARFAGGSIPVAVCNLKGSSVFFTDLVRAMQTDVEFDFMAVSSYGSETLAVGKPKVKRPLFASVEGRDVILVEDIVDTGRTLVTLRQYFADLGARSFTVVALLDKPARRRVNAQADFTCFTVEDAFIVGYGLDYAERYRNLPYIAQLKESVYSS